MLIYQRVNLDAYFIDSKFWTNLAGAPRMIGTRGKMMNMLSHVKSL